jgi:hypothetical protein
MSSRTVGKTTAKPKRCLGCAADMQAYASSDAAVVAIVSVEVFGVEPTLDQLCVAHRKRYEESMASLRKVLAERES